VIEASASWSKLSQGGSDIILVGEQSGQVIAESGRDAGGSQQRGGAAASPLDGGGTSGVIRVQ